MELYFVSLVWLITKHYSALVNYYRIIKFTVVWDIVTGPGVRQSDLIRRLFSGTLWLDKPNHTVTVQPALQSARRQRIGESDGCLTSRSPPRKLVCKCWIQSPSYQRRESTVNCYAWRCRTQSIPIQITIRPSYHAAMLFFPDRDNCCKRNSYLLAVSIPNREQEAPGP